MIGDCERENSLEWWDLGKDSWGKSPMVCWNRGQIVINFVSCDIQLCIFILFISFQVSSYYLNSIYLGLTAWQAFL